MYRKSRGRITPRDVVDFLLFDREFPRAIRFCLSEAEESLLAILGTAHSMYRNEAERRIGQLSAEIDYAQVDDIIRTGLHEYLDSFQTKLNAVGGAISESFFGHTSENATPVGAS